MNAKSTAIWLLIIGIVPAAFVAGRNTGKQSGVLHPTALAHELQNANNVESIVAQATSTSNSTKVVNIPARSRADRASLSREQRIQWLEQNGEMPADADDQDWELAKRTTWWGKPLDPKAFWSGRVLWCDDSALAAARKRGHAWPPIPENAPEAWRNLNRGTNGVGADSAWKTSAFWSEFVRTHPKPPEHLEMTQARLAEIMLEGPKILQQIRGRSRVSEEFLAKSDELAIKDLIKEGYPAEAFTKEALFWAYSFKRRDEYQKLIADGHSPDSPAINMFLQRAAVDTRFVIKPPTSEDTAAARSWRISYLQRLRSEGTDASYINAYLRAWNLSADNVFF